MNRVSSKCGQDLIEIDFYQGLETREKSRIENDRNELCFVLERTPNAWGLELDQTGSKSATETWTWMPDLLRLEIESTGLNLGAEDSDSRPLLGL